MALRPRPFIDGLRRISTSRSATDTAVACAAIVAALVGTLAVVKEQVPGKSRSSAFVAIDGMTPFARTAERGSRIRTEIQSSMVPTSDDWLESVRTGKIFKSSRQSNPAAARARLDPPPGRLGVAPPLVMDEDGEWVEQPGRRIERSGSGGGDTYRTVCVRLCDGFYTPLSFSTTRDKLEQDADRCDATCGGQARMFYYKNPGSEIEDMEDLDGKPYRKLPTAFLYRTTYNAQCTCRPHPWQQEALDRHKLYALQEKGGKGDKDARKQADELSQRLKKAEASNAQQRAEAEKALKILNAADTKPSKGQKSSQKAGQKSGEKSQRDAAARAADPVGKELVGVGMTIPALPDRKDAPRMSRSKDRDARSVAPRFAAEASRLTHFRPVGLKPSAVPQVEANAAPERVRAADAGRHTSPGQPVTPVRN